MRKDGGTTFDATMSVSVKEVWEDTDRTMILSDPWFGLTP